MEKLHLLGRTVALPARLPLFAMALLGAILSSRCPAQVTLTNGQVLQTSGTIGGSAFTPSVSLSTASATLKATGPLTLLSTISASGGGTLTVDTNGYTITVGHDSGNNSLITHTSGVTKTGAGTLVLSGTISGSLTINQGEVTTLGFNTGSSANIGNSTLTTSSFNSSISGGVSINSGGIFKAGAAFTSSGSGSITLSAADSTFDTNGFDVTFGNLISGTGTLNKTGSGTLTLSNSSHSGGTTLSAGTLALGGSGALGSSGTLSFGGGTLKFTANNTTDYSARFSTAAGQAYAFDNNGQNVTLGTGLTSSGGTLTKSGTGTLTLSGTNTYSGTTTVSAGTLQIGNGGTSGSVAGDITNNATVAFNRSDALTYSGVISGSGAVTKSGAGTLTLSGTNTYNGATTLSAGTLKLSGSAANSAFTVAGGTLSGSGTLGALTVSSGGTIAPGNSPGTLHAEATTFASGGNYLWEINNVNGTAGADPGWDLLSVNGGLTISATSADPFTIDVTSLTSGNVAGLATGFSTSASYSFTVVSTTTGISGFSADKFHLDTSGFANAFDGTWALALANGGNDLALTYTGASAVPEPSTYALLAGCAALGLITWRRRAR